MILCSQIKEETVSFLYFDRIYKGIVSNADTSIDVCEFFRGAKPVTAEVGYGQRFQEFPDWMVYYRELIPSCLVHEEIPFNVSMRALTLAK